MPFTPLHAVVGIGIVSIISNPWISIPLAFISHAFLDCYPKWYDESQSNRNIWAIVKNTIKDGKVLTLGIVEILLAAFILVFLLRQNSLILWSGVIAANLMDIWDAVNVLFKKKEFWFCHPGGWFPVKAPNWHFTKMSALQTATLDAIFVLVSVMTFLFR